MNIQNVRNVLRLVYGKRKYKIKKDDTVHVFGFMPHSNVEGWYLLGYLDDPFFVEIIKNMRPRSCLLDVE